MKWTIKEYAENTEWWFDDDFIKYAILGNKDFREVGNDDIIKLYKNLDNLNIDIDNMYCANEEGIKECWDADANDFRMWNDDDFIDTINYYLNFTSEELKDFARPCSKDNFKNFMNVLNKYELKDDEDIVADLLTLITGIEYFVVNIYGTVQGSIERQYVIAPSGTDTVAISSVYFGTCAEVYNDDENYYDIIPIAFCTDEQAKKYIIENFDGEAEVYKETSRQVTQYEYTVVE